jgi:predicted Zn-dependent peptidase
MAERERTLIGRGTPPPITDAHRYDQKTADYLRSQGLRIEAPRAGEAPPTDRQMMTGPATSFVGSSPTDHEAAKQRIAKVREKLREKLKNKDFEGLGFSTKARERDQKAKAQGPNPA